MKIVYIDAQNVHKGIQNYHNRTLDWGRFFVYCKERFQADNIKIFFGYISKYHTLYETLKIIGYEVCFKETLLLPDGTIKGNVDIDIAIVALEDFFEGSVQEAFLATGDGDYNSLISFWKKKNIFGQVMIPGAGNSSKLLYQAASKNVIDIATMKNKLQKNFHIATEVLVEGTQ